MALLPTSWEKVVIELLEFIEFIEFIKFIGLQELIATRRELVDMYNSS